ncbi:MAG TPA: IPT/TIG domain-containing protein [Candidatus Angelobacter sp.]|nr:IPT/TIG domain-containing protein [Candidatus Angelobacter sp.]
MKRYWTALAVALVTIFAVAGCNDYGNTFQNNTGAFLTFLSPANIPACVPAPATPCPGFTATVNGSPAFTITMNGSGFVAQTRVQWNGKTCPTSGGTCTTTVTLDANNNVLSVTAAIPASFVAKPGMATVNTVNPASGAGQNGLSNVINFIINNPPNPPPTISNVSPACAVVGNSLALTVTGTNFLSGPANTTPPQVSTLTWTLGSTQTQFTTGATITSTQITATIPATSINMAGSASVTVSNPPSLPVTGIPGSQGSGGGTSSPPASVTVQAAACPAAAKGSAAAEAIAIAEETPAISQDGRYVAYTAAQDGHSQIFFRDTCENAPAGCQSFTTLLSVSGDGRAAAGDSHAPSMSSNGRYVAFSSAAANLIESVPPGRQIYLRDTCAGAAESCKPTTILVSADSNGALVGTESLLPSVSSSGRFVAFLAVTASHSASSTSPEAKSPANSTNSGYRQVFVRDTCLGATNCTPRTTRISLQPGDGSTTTAKPAGPALGGNAKNLAIAGENSATLFTRSVAVDDSVFLAITNEKK